MFHISEKSQIIQYPFILFYIFQGKHSTIMPKSQVTICMLLKRSKESQSLIILPSSNCFQMGTFNDVKYYNVIKKKKKIQWKEPKHPPKNKKNDKNTFEIIKMPKFP